MVRRRVRARCISISFSDVYLIGVFLIDVCFTDFLLITFRRRMICYFLLTRGCRVLLADQLFCQGVNGGKIPDDGWINWHIHMRFELVDELYCHKSTADSK